MPRFCRFGKDPSAFRPQDDRWSAGTARINAGTRRAAAPQKCHPEQCEESFPVPRFCRFEKDPSAFRPQDDRWSVGTARINAGTRRAAAAENSQNAPAP